MTCRPELNVASNEFLLTPLEALVVFISLVAIQLLYASTILANAVFLTRIFSVTGHCVL